MKNHSEMKQTTARAELSSPSRRRDVGSSSHPDAKSSEAGERRGQGGLARRLKSTALLLCAVAGLGGGLWIYNHGSAAEEGLSAAVARGDEASSDVTADGPAVARTGSGSGGDAGRSRGEDGRAGGDDRDGARGARGKGEVRSSDRGSHRNTHPFETELARRTVSEQGAPASERGLPEPQGGLSEPQGALLERANSEQASLSQVQKLSPRPSGSSRGTLVAVSAPLPQSGAVPVAVTGGQNQSEGGGSGGSQAAAGSQADGPRGTGAKDGGARDGGARDGGRTAPSIEDMARRGRQLEAVNEREVADAAEWAKSNLPETAIMYEKAQGGRSRAFLRGIIVTYFRRMNDLRETEDQRALFATECRNMDDLVGLTRDYLKGDDKEKDAVRARMQDRMRTVVVSRLQERRNRLDKLRERLDRQETALQLDQDRVEIAATEQLDEVLNRVMRGVEDRRRDQENRRTSEATSKPVRASEGDPASRGSGK